MKLQFWLPELVFSAGVLFVWLALRAQNLARKRRTGEASRGMTPLLGASFILTAAIIAFSIFGILERHR